MTRIKKCKYKCFDDIKNLLNFRTYNKLVTALNSNQRIFFKRLVNGNVYTYKVTTDNKNNWGILIRNISRFSAYAMLIPKNAITNYNDFVIINE